LALLLALVMSLGAALFGLSAPSYADDSPFVVTMTPSSSTVASGDPLTYTIDVNNSGGDVTQDTMLIAQTNGLTGLILTSNVGTCTQTDNQVTCTAGNMPGFSNWRVTIRGTVTAANGTTLFNGVTVTGNHESSGYETVVNSQVLVSNSTSAPKPDLRISVQGPATIPDATNVTYQLTVNNSGGVNAVDVRVVNNLPAGMSVVSASGNSLFACSSAGLTTTCDGGRVNAGANATITIVANSGGQTAGSQLKDTAVVDPFDTIDELDELNNTGSLISVSGADAAQSGLTITKVDAPDPLRPGDLLTYTITVKNIDTKNRADNVSVSDVTQGLDASSIVATTTKGVCTVSAPKVTCTQKSPTLRLDPNETMTVTIKGYVTNTAGSLITNTATVTGVIKNKSVTNNAMTTTSVRPGVDLSVVMVAATTHFDADDTPLSTDPFRAFDEFRYDIAVGNSGLDDANDVLVRLVVAPGVTLKSDTLLPPDTTCAQAGQVITCTLDEIQGAFNSGQVWGTVQNFSIIVVSPPHPGTIQATVTVDPTNAIFEPDETNNVWTISTPIVTGIDLTVSKTADDPIAPSGTLKYTIFVDNLGTEDAAGVTFKDFLPAGTRFRSIDDVSGHNFTCSHDGSATGGVVECHGGLLTGTHDHTDYNPAFPVGDRAVFELVVFAPAAPGFYTNQVRVDPAGAIPELLESNNIAFWTTEIEIPAPGDEDDYHAFHEFTIDKVQTAPGAADAFKVVPSGIVEYDLIVTNLGSDVAFDVTVEDIIPVGFTFRFAKDTLPGTGDFQCNEAGGVITCSGGTLDGSIGQTAQAGDTTRTIHVSLFANSQPGDYTNKALIDPDNTHPEANETNNSDEYVTTVALGGGGTYIDFDITNVQSSPVDGGGAKVDVAPSGALQYTVTVRNLGSAVAFGVKVQDTLPTGSVFRSAQDVTGPASGKFTCSESGGVVTCTGGTLDGAAGPDETPSPSTRQIVIEVFAPTEPDTYFNVAKVDPGHEIPEADETNNIAQESTNVRINGGNNFRDLVVSSLTSSDDEPEPGQEYSYEVTVANTGTNPAYNVKLRNVLDEGPTFVRATAENDFTCGISGNVLTCDGGVLDGSADLDPNFDTDAIITITVRAPQRHNFTYGVISRVDPDNTVAEANEANNSRTKDVTVKSLIDLATTVSSTGSQGNPGNVAFTATNNGTSAATNVKLVVEMPVGVIPQNLGTIPAGWTCQIEENPINKVTCHGDLAGGATVNFNVTTFVTATTITANAFIDPDNTIVESNEGNNAANG
jgi:uncharacterized repeat protein (TIGR01451 family)